MCRVIAVRDMQFYRREEFGGMRQQQVLNSTRNAVLIAIAVIIAACASSNLRVRSDYDRSANFKQYRTFAIREGNSSGNPVMDQRIREDIASALNMPTATVHRRWSHVD